MSIYTTPSIYFLCALIFCHAYITTPIKIIFICKYYCRNITLLRYFFLIIRVLFYKGRPRWLFYKSFIELFGTFTFVFGLKAHCLTSTIFPNPLVAPIFLKFKFSSISKKGKLWMKLVKKDKDLGGVYFYLFLLNSK